MIKLFHTYIHPEAIRLATQVLHSGFVNEGNMTDKFENELKQRFQMPNVVTVNACTSALNIALKLCNVKNREVLLPAQTFVATGTAVLEAGGIPIFVDINPDTGNIDPTDVYLKLNKKTAAIIAVDWGGNPAPILNLPHTVPIISDAAQSLGSINMGMNTGSLADFTTFSFQAIKSLCTVNGGALSFLNPNLENDIREYKWFGMNKKDMSRHFEGDRDFLIDKLGHKYDFSNLNAALGLGNLTDFDNRLYIRTQIANFYLKNLQDVSGLWLPTYTKNTHPSWWLFTIKVKNRKNFIKKLRTNNIECSVVDRGIDKHPIFNSSANLPNQRWFDEHQVSIPCNERMNDSDMHYIVDVIRKGW